MIRDKVARRVHRAAKFLDKHGRRSWFRSVDPDQLDMRYWCDCVLGQLYGVDLQWLPKGMCRRITFGGHLYAFGIRGMGANAEQLREAWRDEIATRMRTRRLLHALVNTNAEAHRDSPTAFSVTLN